ncbi:MAG: tetratricopeptide repeat protein [Opitutales bacterium]|nr:tetratricopeptide repeat protein [Opitutales bacterium]
MSISLTQCIRNEIKAVLGPKVNLSDEAITRSLITGHLLSTGKLQVKDIIPVPQQHQDMLYATAYDFFQKQQYQDACRIFSILSVYDPQQTKYLEGLAATYHHLKQHRDALLIYCALTFIAPENLAYFLHLAEEFCKLGQFQPAIKCCEAIECLAKEEPVKSHPDTASFLKRANNLRTILNKKA